MWYIVILICIFQYFFQRLFNPRPYPPWAWFPSFSWILTLMIESFLANRTFKSDITISCSWMPPPSVGWSNFLKIPKIMVASKINMQIQIPMTSESDFVAVVDIWTWFVSMLAEVILPLLSSAWKIFGLLISRCYWLGGVL